MVSVLLNVGTCFLLFAAGALAQDASRQQKDGLPADGLTAPASPKALGAAPLLATARKYGSVSVIVGLNVPNTAAQDSLFKRMASHNIKDIQKLDAGTVAMRIDAAALQQLIGDPEVTSIEEDSWSCIPEDDNCPIRTPPSFSPASMKMPTRAMSP